MADEQRIHSRGSVAIKVEITPGATLPQAIDAMLRIARKNDVCVCSTWNGHWFVVRPEESYVAAQERVLKALGQHPVPTSPVTPATQDPVDE
jgi:hypothetical protein